jgi:hypothetical protein
MWSRADLLLATEPTTKVIEDVTDGDSVVRPRSPSRVERPKRQSCPFDEKELNAWAVYIQGVIGNTKVTNIFNKLLTE